MSRTTEHKEGKANVKAVYFTSKTLADGSHPFMVRITKDRARKYIATGLSLHPKFWNEQKNEIRRSYPDPYRSTLLDELRKWEEKYRNAAETLSTADENHDAKAVASKAIENRKATRRVQMLAYLDELIATLIEAKQTGNTRVYKDFRNQLTKFIQAKYQTQDLPFDQITVTFCKNWETALRAQGLTEITLSLRFRTLRAVLNKAIADGVAKPETYPFARNVAERNKFSVGKFDVSTKKRAISRDDIRKIETYESADETSQLAQRVFLFSFYGGGINFVDLAQLRWKNITVDTDGNQRLNYVRQKTGGRFSFRLLPPAQAIVDSYRAYRYAGPDSYIFPILETSRHIKPNQIENRLNKVMGQVNAGLKTIAEDLGISTRLTTYVARHSFATSLKRAGVSTGVISQAMGHKTENVTAIYLDSFDNQTIDSALENLL
jgi:integrase